MNKEPKPHRIPSERIIAKNYAAGHVTDYPADIIFTAINNQKGAFQYNSIAIPIEESFADKFWRCLPSLVYLHKKPIKPEKEEAFLSDPYSILRKRYSLWEYCDMDSIVANFMLAISKSPFYELATGKTQTLIEYLAENDLHHLCRVEYPQGHFRNFPSQTVAAIFDYNVDFRALGLGPDFDTNIILLVKAIFE